MQLVDIPDCYVKIDVPESLEEILKTSCDCNSENPIWNEELCFHIPPDVSNPSATVSKHICVLLC